MNERSIHLEGVFLTHDQAAEVPPPGERPLHLPPALILLPLPPS